MGRFVYQNVQKKILGNFHNEFLSMTFPKKFIQENPYLKKMCVFFIFLKNYGGNKEKAAYTFICFIILHNNLS